MPFRDFLENIPNLWCLALDHLLCASDRMNVSKLFQPANNEWFKENQRHFLRKTALIQSEFRSDDDDRTARVIDTFPEQVLPETSTFTFEHVAQRLQRAITCAGDSATMAAIVEQRIDSL